MNQQEKIIKYFLSNIFEAKSSYTQWKMINGARSSGIVGLEMAERYTAIQNIHPQFFLLTEIASQRSFIILLCHAFDERFSDSMSLDKVDKVEYDSFVNKNIDVIEKIKKVRNKVIAHKSLSIDPKDIQIPSIDALDIFFINLEKLYNKLSAKITNSTAWFDNVSILKNDIEILYMNIERGEAVRKKEIDIKYKHDMNPNKVSKIL